MAHLERDTRVGRLRIRAAAGDELALAMRGEAVLRPLDLRPPGMPWHAILCIRRMDDPLPRAIDLRTAHPPRPTEWERAARGVIAEALRRAVRVRDCLVPADADVVMFEDRAVLLAAAARDAVRGRLGQWYWKKLLRAATFEAVLHEWQRHARYVAGAIELLADDAVAFIGSIESAHAAALTATLVQTMQLPPLPHRLPRQWRDLAPVAAHAALSDEQRTLLATALILRRAPEAFRAEPVPREALHDAKRTSTAVKTRPSRSRLTKTTIRESATPRAKGSSTAQPNLAATPQRTHAATAPARIRTITKSWHAAAAQSRDRAHARTATAAAPLSAGNHPIIAAGDQPATGEAIHSTHAGAFFLLSLVDWKFLRLTARMLVPSIEEDALWRSVLVVRPRPCAASTRRRRIQATTLAPALQTLTRARRTLASRKVSPELLIRQRGTVVITPAHLDVTFSLERHPIEIRMAGLDRDPGWIAAIGRHVAFHFD